MQTTTGKNIEQPSPLMEQYELCRQGDLGNFFDTYATIERIYRETLVASGMVPLSDSVVENSAEFVVSIQSATSDIIV